MIYNHETKLKNQSPFMHVNTYVKEGILIYSAWENGFSWICTPFIKDRMTTSTRIHLFCAQFNIFLTTMASKLHCSSARHYLPLWWLFTATIWGPKLSNWQGKLKQIVSSMKIKRTFFSMMCMWLAIQYWSSVPGKHFEKNALYATPY